MIKKSQLGILASVLPYTTRLLWVRGMNWEHMAGENKIIAQWPPKKRKEKETYLAKFARQKLITGVKSNQGDIQRKMMPQAQNTVSPFPLHCTSYPRHMHANERNRTIMLQAA